VVYHISWNCRFFNRSFLSAAGWIGSIPDYQIRKSNPASDVHRRTIAAGHHLVMVTLVGEECGGPVLPSTPFFLAAFFLCQYWFSAWVTLAIPVRSLTGSSNFSGAKYLTLFAGGLFSGLSRCAAAVHCPLIR
jgi:hypothetical protein